LYALSIMADRDYPLPDSAAGAAVAAGPAAVSAGALVGEAAGVPPQAASKLAIIMSPTKTVACFLIG
jgi:hypothetical protein